ncbi:MAG: SMC-Scp complex subunit ScpB [Candidatus Woesearchaeota archaeon]|nr:SMC-Scp complex subunit ScpB [Candidatus Woesearchaeota archaeon]
MSLAPKHQVEALLFSSGKTMSEEQLTLLTKLEKAVVHRALLALKKEYNERESAVVVVQDGNDWKMSVQNEYVPLVKNIVADTELSKACMETLGVIAYRYPKALQSSVIDVRGSGAYEHIAELEQLGFLTKVRAGRSYKLKLTDKFFEYFDVAGEKDIKSVFKHVKLPDTEQQKLGEMDVVDVEKKDDGLEVVDVSAVPEKPDIPEPEEPEEEDDTPAGEFLDELDKKIDEISRKNDEHAADEQLQRNVDEASEDEEKREEESENVEVAKNK